MKTMLYPLKFKPILQERIWGGNRFDDRLKIGENWVLSGISGFTSIVDNGELNGYSLTELIEDYKNELLGEAVVANFGMVFPILIKFLDTALPLSIQVHPDNTLAKKKHNSFGKAEMWYVVDKKPNAKLLIGFNQKIDKTSYLNHIEKNTIETVINEVYADIGDVFYLPAGRVHAIGAGLFLAEIQQSSDITYRIYDYERVDDDGNKRDLHTDLALDAIDFTKLETTKITYNKINDQFVNLVDCPYFTTKLIAITEKIELQFIDKTSFKVYICIEGNSMISYNNNEINLAIGECVLIPACLEQLTITPKYITKLIVVEI